MTKQRRSKSCRDCGAKFIESYGDSESQWANRRFCSVKCVSVHFAKIRAKSIFERLEERQVKLGADKCWKWDGTKDNRGYGVYQEDLAGDRSSSRKKPTALATNCIMARFHLAWSSGINVTTLNVQTLTT